MCRYREVVKADVRRRMSPPMWQSVVRISEELGIHVVTLYTWRKAQRLQVEVVPAGMMEPEGWSAADKFTVALETADLNSTDRSIAITAKEHKAATWIRTLKLQVKKGEVAAKANVPYQGNCSCRLRLTSGSIRSLTSDVRLQRDFACRMASVMAIESEVFGGCFEESRIEVGRIIWRLLLVCLAVLSLRVEHLGASVFRLRCWQLCQVLDAFLGVRN